jgi:ankyrin repeat protein
VLRLIVARCSLDGVDGDGFTGLMLASYKGHTDIVNALILAGAALDIENVHGDTALITASYKRHIEIVKALIMAGAVPVLNSTLRMCMVKLHWGMCPCVDTPRLRTH